MDPTPIPITLNYLKSCFGVNNFTSVDDHQTDKNLDIQELINNVRYFDQHDESKGCIRKIMIGYPTRSFSNLFEEIAFIWILWMEQNQFPIQFQKFTLLEDDWHYYSMFEETFTNRILALKQAMDQEIPHIQEMVHSIIRDMGLRGIQTCLRMRKTVGSIRYLIPTYSALVTAFCRVLEPSSGLTVGARALAKHCHRSETDKWWGGSNILKGNAQQKNKTALSILSKILDEATFINSHTLPHNVPCIEVRNHEGYGSRWIYKRHLSSHHHPHNNTENNNPRMMHHTTSLVDSSTSHNIIDVSTTSESAVEAINHSNNRCSSISTSSMCYEDDNQIIFRGFLEPYQANGHESGWKH
ncbi:hypothetical protein C9374_001255 [Naegleria lovaniensis]|uniref:Uncharacterized protein n=1 Tax=Naegleria lovaniensis TaxID=51637 RepID=A0AA88GSP4_NAELO|nr:uncharacterized protein C9374_001255 [Naegleria lovaniensis]KAG2387661.1 hypothetical protein C9374_001255 [Naegleria lovaniensis]